MVSFSFVLLATVVVITLLLSLSHCDAYLTTGLKNAAVGDTVAAEERTNDDRLGGRKFMLDRRQLRRKVKKAEEISKVGDDEDDESASKNSGTKIDARDLGQPTATSEQNQKPELSEKLLDEAESQIVNLMKKDYPGGGGARPRPPINNHEPLH